MGYSLNGYASALEQAGRFEDAVTAYVEAERIIRLTLGEGTTWCAETPAKSPSSSNDTPSKFVGVKGSVPASCPALP